MSLLSKHFKNTAEAMESGRCRQTFGMMSTADGSVCAMGCMDRIAHGMGEEEFYHHWISPDYGQDTATIYGVDSFFFNDTLRRVAEKVVALTGIEIEPEYNNIIVLNDTHKVPFSTFARAFRAVALELEEEEEYGEPITPAVREELVAVR